MEIQLTEELVQSVLPNTLITVDEEFPLSARIEPYVKDSIRWIESLVIGDVELPPELEEMAVRAVIIRAVIHAIPAMDLVVTPSGFGVVSSQNLAPASKERIERLIDSLSSSLNEQILLLQEKCVNCEDWRNSDRGRWYCSTFLPFLADVSYQSKDDIYEVYKIARGLAEKIESMIAEEYIGFELMNSLRSGFYDCTYDMSVPVISALRTGIHRYVSQHMRKDPYRCPDDHEAWHLAESILIHIKRDPVLFHVWKCTFKNGLKPFKNTRKGGYFF